MKKSIKILCVFIILISICISNSLAHSGRTDSNGGHYVRTETPGYELNSYHYHNGGGTTTNSSSSTSSSTTTSTYVKPVITVEEFVNIDYGMGKELVVNISNSSNTYTATSSDSNILTCEGSKVTAIGVGTAKITISSNGADDVSFDVTVDKTFPESIGEIEDVSIKIGETHQIIPTLNPEKISETNVKWKSSNQSVVTVDENGLLKALSKGTTVVSCETENGLKTEFNVIVLGIEPETCDLVISGVTENENAKNVLTINQLYKIKPEFTPNNVTETDIELVTSDINISFENNELKISKPGEYILEFRTVNGITIYKNVIVEDDGSYAIGNTILIIVTILIFSVMIVSVIAIITIVIININKKLNSKNK